MESDKPINRNDGAFENNEFRSDQKSDDNLFDESEWEDFIQKDAAKLDRKISDELLRNINKLRIGSKQNKKRRVFRTINYTLLVTAAIILAVFGIELYRSQWYGGTNKELFSNSVTIEVTNTGKIEKIVDLPDGSVVTLGPKSRLSYPKQFSDKAREISLHGTATFRVSKDPLKPFSVDCRGLVTVALGTVFTVRENISGTEVYLVEGRVKVFVKNKVQFLSYLTPGDKVFYQPQEEKFLYVSKPLSSQKNNRATSIKDKNSRGSESNLAYEIVGNEYVFKNIELQDLIRSLEKIYSCKIFYPKSIAKNNMYLNVDRNQSIYTVLNNIVLLNDLQLERSAQGQYSIIEKK